MICLLLAVSNAMPFFSAEETNVIFLHFLFFFIRHLSQFLELWSVKSSLWKRLLFRLSFPVCGFVVRLVFLLMFLLFLLKGIFSSSRENSLCFLYRSSKTPLFMLTTIMVSLFSDLLFKPS